MTNKEEYNKTHEELVHMMQTAYFEAEDDKTPEVDLSFLNEERRKKKGRRTKIAAFTAAGVIIALLAANLFMLATDDAVVYGDKGLLHRIHLGLYGLFTDEEEM